MAVRKTPAKNAKRSSRTPKESPRRAPRRRSKYRCPNPGKPLPLRAIVKRMSKDREFARFIRELLCAAKDGDDEASKCVQTYFDPEEAELDALCLPARFLNACRKCTERTILLAAAAFAFSEDHGRSEERER